MTLNKSYLKEELENVINEAYLSAKADLFTERARLSEAAAHSTDFGEIKSLVTQYDAVGAEIYELERRYQMIFWDSGWRRFFELMGCEAGGFIHTKEEAE